MHCILAERGWVLEGMMRGVDLVPEKLRLVKGTVCPVEPRVEDEAVDHHVEDEPSDGVLVSDEVVRRPQVRLDEVHPGDGVRCIT